LVDELMLGQQKKGTNLFEFYFSGDLSKSNTKAFSYD